MTAGRNPDGDGSLWHQAVTELKCVVKRRLAPRGTPADEPSAPYLVVPVLGQSNAQGMGVGLDLNGPDKAHPSVHQWPMSGKSRGRAIIGVDPLLHEVPAKGVGFGVTFAKLLADHTGRSVLLMPCARGDTAFAPKNGYTWDPANTCTRVNLYLDAVDAIDTALARYPGSRVAVVLWHQGESDVPLTAPTEYQVKLDSVIDGLRQRYGEQLPFVLGQMVPEEMERTDRDYSAINAVHADTPNRRALTAFAPGPRSCTNSAKDLHYNAVGQRKLGHSMWEVYRAMCLSGQGAHAPG